MTGITGIKIIDHYFDIINQLLSGQRALVWPGWRHLLHLRLVGDVPLSPAFLRLRELVAAPPPRPPPPPAPDCGQALAK